MDIIETIAIRWFGYNLDEKHQQNSLDVWNNQPDHIKEIFYKKAKEFWDHPDDRFHIDETLLRGSYSLSSLSSRLRDSIKGLEHISSVISSISDNMKTEYNYKKENNLK